MMTITPARIMGVMIKGSIAIGRMPIWYCLMITLLLTPLLLGVGLWMQMRLVKHVLYNSFDF